MKLQLKREGILFSLVGPSGVGKSTLVEMLLRDDAGLRKSISVTSRAPRAGEVEGEHYYFVTREEFTKRLQADGFFESEEIHGNFYGTQKSTVEDSLKHGVDLILDIDIKGALNFKKQCPNHAVNLFLLPPSLDELKRRIRSRSNVSEGELAKRLTTAEREYSDLLECARKQTGVDYVVINSELNSTYEAIRSVLCAERVRLSRIDTMSLGALVNRSS